MTEKISKESLRCVFQQSQWLELFAQKVDNKMKITGRLIGTQKPLFEDWSIDVEPYLEGVDDWILSELIELIVFESSEFAGKNPGVETFLKSIDALSSESKLESKEEQSPLPKASSGSELDSIDMKAQEAMGNAIEAFEEDVYLVVVDGEDIFELDEYVQFHNESVITFVRLIPLKDISQ